MLGLHSSMGSGMLSLHSSMLRYAQVCSGMLKYAQVCSAWRVHPEHAMPMAVPGACRHQKRASSMYEGASRLGVQPSYGHLLGGSQLLVSCILCDPDCPTHERHPHLRKGGLHQEHLMPHAAEAS